MNEIEEQVREAIANVMHLNEDEKAKMTRASNLAEFGGDSQSVIEIALELEYRLDIKIPDEDIEFQTVGQVIDYVTKAVQKLS